MSLTASSAVKIICTKANDPNQESYKELAYDYLNESISDLMNAKNYNTDDVYGLVKEDTEEVNATVGVNMSNITRKIANVEHIFCDPEAVAASSKVIREVDLNFFNGLQGQYGFIDSDTVLMYRVGDNFKFYPASNASGLMVKFIYTEYPDDFNSTEPTTDLLQYFSKNFAYKAISLAAKKLIKERGIE